MSTNESQPQPDSGASSQPTQPESSQPQTQPQQPSPYPQPQPPYPQYQPYSAGSPSQSGQHYQQPQPQPQYPQQQWPQYQPYQPYQYQPYPYAYPPQPPVDPETVRRRTLRKSVGRVAGLALAYQAIFTATSLIAGMVIGLAAAASRYGSQATSGMFSEQELSQFEQEVARQTVQWTGVLYLLAVAVGFAFMLLMRHRTILTRAFWTGDPHEPHAAMRPAWLLAFAAMLVGVQGVSILIQVAFAALGTPLASPTSEGIAESAVTVSMWLYIGLIGPVIEELVFRGVVMKELKPLGRNFAILTSSLMFALFHDDVVQGLFAFACGLIFAFVAMEYSLVWSIALHVFNNAVIGGVFSAIAGSFGDTGNVVYAVCLVIVGVGGLIWVLLKYGWGLREYVRVNRSAPGTYWGWTSGLFLTLVILNVLIALISFAMAMAGAA
ncbi:CPBP family intramembrane glutamic endopeptidase [Bifidobacterium biavatii]|uniref:Putative metal-dependent membrane protease n=1 Tax=Bifidobacterium biavatii DSM 23969 TaxID=1437608 RepID=A0A087A1J8_9BIFI|nr:type II CAAX endopeptidase family protein [Bifidobacterium biavatii]KFI52648.1 putative metal-dependent membrane protease [Bifidobacterium biavatii DSM 23969]